MSLLIRQPLNLGAQTYRMNRAKPDGTPLDGYWETANCERADCEHWRLGWITTIDMSSELGPQQAEYIRKKSRRKFREEPGADSLRLFIFDPGQRCFREHKLPVQRDPRFIRLARGKEAQVLDYDQFHEDWNETVTRISQNNRVV